MPDNPPARTAVVAGTAFGARVHARALKAAGFEVVGLVGRDLEKTRHRAARAGIPHAFASLDDALALGPLVVAVSTPPASHFELSRKALDAGAHVVCEKPFTLVASQARELVDQARSSGLIGLLGHEFRYTEAPALFGRLLAAGAVGEPRLAAFVAHGGLVADPDREMPAWWFDEASGGGWLGASGSHGVDRVRAWYGEIAGVSARLLSAGSRTTPGAEDSFDIRFTSVCGVEGVLQSTAAAWGPGLSVTRVVGTQGTMWIEDVHNLGSVEAVDGTVMVATRDGVAPVEIPADLKLDTTGIEPAFQRNVAPFAALYRDLLRLIGGEPPRPGAVRPATFEDGWANMRLLDAIRASAAGGGAWIEVG
jgi:predicted dehydrogenase